MAYFVTFLFQKSVGYQSYKFTLDYDSIEIKENKATIQLRESHQVVFKALAPDPSYLYNLEHIITLKNKQDKWVVTDDKYQDELYSLMSNESKDEILERIRINYEEEQKQKKLSAFQGLNDNTIASQNQFPDFTTPASTYTVELNPGDWHEYYRTPAVEYANKWASNSQILRNPTWGNFDPPNGNGDCTNYVSQVIFAGAPQMDTTGSYQWYYYGYNSRSPSWTDVDSLYTYLISNTWIGPYGSVITNECALRGGDIIQLKSGSTWFHSLSVVAVLANCTNIGPGTAVKYNAHTTDRYQYPLSYVSAYTKRLIQIQGWREGEPYTTFADVPPSHWAWEDIGRLYNSGITGGCATNPLRYCPENAVTCAEMAIFLLRGIHGGYYDPPAPTGTVFIDVPASYWAAEWIKQLAREGITGGCATGYYCPNSTATHAQMAIFLLRSKYGASYNPPDVGGSTGFYDVPVGYWAAAWIKQLAAEGISYGLMGAALAITALKTQ